MALTASGGASAPLTATPANAVKSRLALVVPKRNPDRMLNAGLAQDLRSATPTWDLHAVLLPVEETSSRQRANLLQRIETGGFGLVLVFGDGVLATTVSSVVRRMPQTTFVFLDASLTDLSLEGVPNASAVRFKEEDASQVMGYLSALVPTRRGLPHVDVVSIVAGPSTPHRERVIAGFKDGVAHAQPGVDVLVGYADDVFDPTDCERLANEQIDRGSDVVYVEAGLCGRGALVVAQMRGVWAAGGYDDAVRPGAHVLLLTGKDYGRALFSAIQDYVLKATRFGEDIELGIEDDYAMGFDGGNLKSVVSESLWSKVVRRCSEIRQRAAASSS
jgi:basic membrane lipoprotein Med (substrate-binding protein (PBP1-ABC) superfamily)